MSSVSMESLTKLERIGKGSYGEVFKARMKGTGTIVVVKEVSLVGISKDEEREILNESQVMLQVEHKHVIRFVASFVENSTLHIVMDLASGGDLAAAVRGYAARGERMEEEVLWKYLIQLTEGLQHLHSRRILHRDIKASNIFVDSDGNVKIGDLGLGKILTGTAQCAQSKVGTPLYFSPEICEGKPYDTKSDVWALGCLMHELATLRPPFHAQNQIALAKKIVNDQPDMRVPSRYSKELQFIIGKMLEKDPRKRPSPDSLLNYSAVQIRADRAKFREREEELVNAIRMEREKGMRAEDERALMQVKLDALLLAQKQEMESRQSEVQALLQKVALLEARCEKFEAEAAVQQQSAKRNSERAAELDVWENDLAGRELELLKSQATEPGQANDNRTGISAGHHSVVQTPLDRDRLSRSGSRPPVPTPSELFPTPAPQLGDSTGEDRTRNLPSTPMRSHGETARSATPGGSKPPGTPIVDGYLRARARTPSRSLGPPKRISTSSQGEDLCRDSDHVAYEDDPSCNSARDASSRDFALSAHQTWGSHEPGLNFSSANASPDGCSSATRAPRNSTARPPMATITNVHSAQQTRSAQKGIVTETGERLLASASASSAAKARQMTASEGCSPQVEYILAYTDRMRQAAQQAIESCATSSSGSSSGGSGRKVPQERVCVTAPAKDDDSKPRRKLLFSGVANSDAPLLQ